MQAPLPANEEARLAKLHEYQILDTLPEQGYDDITYLASQICKTPVSLITLVDHDRQWFKSRVGLGLAETSRDFSFCAHAILQSGVMIVPDALQDQRFADNPLVTGDPHIRFYAGAPLIAPSGEALGTLCVIDRQPRQLGEEEQKALAALASQVMAQLELRRAVHERQRYQELLEEANARLKLQADHDELTGLCNRRVLMARFKEEFHRALRYDQPLSLLMLDVDQFKAYNDTFGHPAGDEVLRQIAHLVKMMLRAGDIPARYGGEEFAVVLPNTSAQGAMALAERLRQTVAHVSWPLRPVTVSVGVASQTAAAEDPLTLIAAADQALYEAKRAGRNRVVQAP
ncbi:MAG TPA: sensor domain-containing diguanylate cyclase [Meiothermus sp.]|nr:sensor domain-containing diguanylate cyclase [Meiothermus sp.]